MEKEFAKIEGRKFSLGNSYFKNKKENYPDTILEIAQYREKYKELPFDYGGEDWLYEAATARQKKHSIHHDQYFTPDAIAKQEAELTNNFLPEGNNVLNACCGIGQLTKYLLDSKLNVFGYDNDEELVETCKLAYPDATFYKYDFSRDNQILADCSKIRYWDLIVANPPVSKVNIVSFINWLSHALSDKGKAIVLMSNDFEYKNYNKLYKSYVGRFKILCKEPLAEDISDSRYKGMIIYMMELKEEYRKERALTTSGEEFVIKEKTNETKKEKTQIMERQDLKKIQNVRLDKIIVNPLNPRKKFNESDISELAQSIKQVGLLQAITLRKKDGKLEIVAGECRYRAFCLNAEETIPAVIGEYTDAEVMLLALAENMNRNNLSPLEEANAFNYLITNKQYTLEDLSLKFGKNETFIRNRLGLLMLIPDFKNMLENDGLSIGASIELAKYSASIQQEVYETFYKESNSPVSWANISRKELSNRLIKQYTMTLDDYEFDKDECRTCHNNTDTNTLFDECKGKCTDLACLRGKQRQYTLDMCKTRVEQDNFEVIVSPSDRLNPEVTEKLKEEGIEVKTSVSYETPEAPQKPKRENFKLECDYQDALDKYNFEDLEYNAEIAEYEKKVEDGEYSRCLHIGGNTPKICYSPVKKEGRGHTIKELEEQARLNYETTKSNIIRNSLDLIRSGEIISKEFSVLEEEIFLFLMLGYVSKKQYPLFGINDPSKESLSDKDKEAIISRITNAQYGILKREFILRCIIPMNINKLSPKFQLYLQSFAQQHFPQKAEKIVKRQLEIYNKDKKKIEKEINKLESKQAVQAES